MNTSPLSHRWDLSPAEAIALQRELAASIVLHLPSGFDPKTICGVDIGFEDEGRITRAAMVVLDRETLQPADHTIARLPTTFPYVPGLLSFREIPAALKAFDQLAVKPDLLMVDGQGIAHPRRLGVASHLGLLLDMPAIGVAKSLLTGHHAPVPDARGAWVPLLAKQLLAKHPSIKPATPSHKTTAVPAQEIIGAVMRSRIGVQPIIVSPGHRIDFDSALDWVLRCLGRYRLPEPTRWADGLASRRPVILRQLDQQRLC